MMLDQKKQTPPNIPLLTKSYSQEKQTLPTSSRTKLGLLSLMGELDDLKDTLQSFNDISGTMSTQIIKQTISKEIKQWVDKFQILMKEFQNKCNTLEVIMMNIEYYREKQNKELFKDIRMKQQQIQELKLKIDQLTKTKEKEMPTKTEITTQSIATPQYEQDFQRQQLENKLQKYERQIHETPYKFQTSAEYVYNSDTKYEMIDKHRLLQNRFKNLMLKQRYNKYKTNLSRKSIPGETKGTSTVKRNASGIFKIKQTDDSFKTSTPRIQKKRLEQIIVIEEQVTTEIPDILTSTIKLKEQTPQIISSFLETLRMF